MPLDYCPQANWLNGEVLFSRVGRFPESLVKIYIWIINS